MNNAVLTTSLIFLKRHRISIGAFLIILLVWLFCLPKPLFKDPTATVVTSKEGLLLGARIADDGQWRFPANDSVPHRFEVALLEFEDAYFYKHPGFNPIAMSKALWANLTTKKQRGGSTLTQQVIRLSRKNPGRTYYEKLIELAMATRLEAGYRKSEILKLYASNAPFGGNVVGLESASWRYFGIPASELSWGQAAALAVLPNNPALVFPGKNERIFKAKRNRLLKKLYTEKHIDSTTYELALSEQLPGKPQELPDAASHFTERVAREKSGEFIKSTLRFNLQSRLNQIAAEAHYKLDQNNIHNLAILVLDVNTREVLGYIGNASTTAEHANYVDIITSNRSTGSTLKPFLFASLLSAGELLPNTLVADVPTSINGYNPQNFDRNFQGAVPASEALARSLNVPAVNLLREYGLKRFYNVLQKLNFKTVTKPADYYGLSLILGGAESNLWQLTNAYAGMAATLNYFNTHSSEYRDGLFNDPVYICNDKNPEIETNTQPEFVDAGAIYQTLETLREVNRPTGSENWEFFNEAQPIAWKTGTSYGFKDAWAVGVTGSFAIGVWAGNADGEGRPGITGIQAAAPILFDVLSILPASPWFQKPFDELVEAELCTQSGNLAGLYCPETKLQWIPKKGTRTEACTFHTQIFLNKEGDHRVNADCYPLGEMISQSWFSLPPVWEYYYAPLHPEYKPLPDFELGCFRESEKIMEFIYPKRGETILIPKDFNDQQQEVIFKLAHRNPDTIVYWYLDNTFINSTETFHELSLALSPGSYILSATDSAGNTIKQRIQIKFASS
ncbi:penicillin-binding protein 1C [Leeuwenhoekiella sp. MAR_2009_132]|uniref:penicillin-binding protein 1C n=1 Tax=Leeuwenhoekiella sp. MAR_2009_132 TaxID=1392489 RepID=UPI000B210EBD|nr:penicillin-binding protein 1C [Leeuwenhoekiella sp. MAR_2009_132]